MMSALAAGLLLVASGCASAPVQGNGVVMSQQFFGNLGVVGNGSNITVLPGSRLEKISVIGNNCQIFVHDNVTLWKIEFWGNGNAVSLPETLVVRLNNVGKNQVIKRPRGMDTPNFPPPAESDTTEPPPASDPGQPSFTPPNNQPSGT
jgi:hypothetical protein